MTNLYYEKNKFLSLIRRGDTQDNYIVIGRGPQDHWYFLHNGTMELIRQLTLAHDHGDGIMEIEYEYEYGIDQEGAPALWVRLIIENETKVLVEDMSNLVGFGFDDIEPPVEAFNFYARTDNHEFSYKYHHGSSVGVLRDLGQEASEAPNE